METQKRDFSDLDARFTPYFESGERVEVEWKKGFEDFTGYGCKTEGKKARFYVGRSTGWKPIYIALLRRDSSGGGCILSVAVKSIRGLGVYRDRRVGNSPAWRIVSSRELSTDSFNPNDYL